MNEIQTCSNELFGTIRGIEVNGKMLFVGSDVAKSAWLFGHGKSDKNALQRGVQNGHTNKWWYAENADDNRRGLIQACD